jgi:SAM-dependent methyltransferase
VSRNESTRRSYDAVAARYRAEMADELAGKPLDRSLLDAFAELAPDGPLADLGCGPGQIGAYLAGGGRAVVGSDLSPVMCQQAQLPSFAGDMTALPIRSGSLAGLTCFYAVIHLDPVQREAAYGEFARVLVPGGLALISFHTSDADVASGQARHFDEWWGTEVDLTFHFLDPDEEVGLLLTAGFELAARLDRAPHDEAEHPSNRSYLLLRRPARSTDV